MTTWANINLQDMAFPILEQLIYFHDHASIIIVIILTVVSYITIILIINNLTNHFLLEGLGNVHGSATSFTRGIGISL